MRVIHCQGPADGSRKLEPGVCLYLFCLYVVAKFSITCGPKDFYSTFWFTVLRKHLLSALDNVPMLLPTTPKVSKISLCKIKLKGHLQAQQKKRAQAKQQLSPQKLKKMACATIQNPPVVGESKQLPSSEWWLLSTHHVVCKLYSRGSCSYLQAVVYLLVKPKYWI